MTLRVVQIDVTGLASEVTRLRSGALEHGGFVLGGSLTLAVGFKARSWGPSEPWPSQAFAAKRAKRFR